MYILEKNGIESFTDMTNRYAEQIANNNDRKQKLSCLDHL